MDDTTQWFGGFEPFLLFCDFSCFPPPQSGNCSSSNLMSETSQAETALSLDNETNSPPKESTPPSKELRRSFEAVKDEIPMSIDDPSAFADWSCEAVQSFVTAAGAGGMHPPPAW
eukprot:1326130-Rhodomonas_salina.1